MHEFRAVVCKKDVARGISEEVSDSEMSKNSFWLIRQASLACSSLL